MFSTRLLIRSGLLFATLFGTTACDPVSLIFGTGAVLGIAQADERRIPGVASDVALRTKINCTWLTEESVLLDRLTLSVIEGNVVLTGVVETPELKEKALAITRSVSGVKKVIDEIRVGEPESFSDYSRDSWISTKLKTTLLLDPHVATRNYSIRTVNRIIYLTGIAQSQEELDLVLTAAKDISGVKHVVNHVRIKDPSENPPNVPVSDEENSLP